MSVTCFHIRFIWTYFQKWNDSEQLRHHEHKCCDVGEKSRHEPKEADLDWVCVWRALEEKFKSGEKVKKHLPNRKINTFLQVSIYTGYMYIQCIHT